MFALAARISGAQESDPFAAAVQALLAQGGDTSERPLERAAMARIYPVLGSGPLWIRSDGSPTVQAFAAIDVLASAGSRGLASADYEAAGLLELVPPAGATRAAGAGFDVALTRSMTRFLADLHFGRVDPGAVRFDLPNVSNPVELAALVTAVARAPDVETAVADAEPPYAGYQALRRALARYRVLAADTLLRPPRRVATTIRPGDRYADVPALARLLWALGDLDSTSAEAATRAAGDSVPVYDPVLAGAVTRFQLRHGLDADGALGPATMRQLRVPLAHRVRQIELTLERWRWLPGRAPSRSLVVNIPAFRVYAFEDDSAARRPVLAMNVIVGQSSEGRHDTPVFTATMREVVFRPYWDVPPRIARTELIPIVRRRPEYFVTEGFEIVRLGAPDTATTTFPPTAQSLARVAAGTLRIRQRPGRTNALGFVKFVFPNRYSVYMHGTPLQELFASSRRDFSHGCIRVEEPNDLAELVLRGQAGWDREAIDSVARGTRTVHVPIARPVTVLVLYATAVTTDGGTVSFYPDLYRHDAALERALGLPAIPAPR